MAQLRTAKGIPLILTINKCLKMNSRYNWKHGKTASTQVQKNTNRRITLTT